METLEKAKFVPKEKAVKVVNRVFDKCYADLEPLGRRPINAKDMKRAYNERYLCENWINMDQKERQNCEINVIKALSSSPRIRLLVQALNNSGCPFIPSRHIDCRWGYYIFSLGFLRWPNIFNLSSTWIWNSLIGVKS